MITEHIAKQRSEALVIALVGEATSDKWWNSRNTSFDNKTPLEMWNEDWDRVYNYLMHYGFAGGGS